jgi:hypothetical protein
VAYLQRRSSMAFGLIRQFAPLSGHISICGLQFRVGFSGSRALTILSRTPTRINPITHDLQNHLDCGACVRVWDAAISLPPYCFPPPMTVGAQSTPTGGYCRPAPPSPSLPATSPRWLPPIGIPACRGISGIA